MRVDREAAFRDFVTDKYPSLVRLAYLMLGDRGLAEDLAQTALVKVYGTWGSIREPASASLRADGLLEREADQQG